MADEKLTIAGVYSANIFNLDDQKDADLIDFINDKLDFSEVYDQVTELITEYKRTH